MTRIGWARNKRVCAHHGSCAMTTHLYRPPPFACLGMGCGCNRLWWLHFLAVRWTLTTMPRRRKAVALSHGTLRHRLFVSNPWHCCTFPPLKHSQRATHTQTHTHAHTHARTHMIMQRLMWLFSSWRLPCGRLASSARLCLRPDTVPPEGRRGNCHRDNREPSAAWANSVQVQEQRAA